MKLLLALLLSLSTIDSISDEEFIFVFLHKKEDKTELPKEEVDKIMAGHMANIQRLAKEGKLVVAGPFEGGGGIFIFKSHSADQVKEWLKTDPGVSAKRWNVEMLSYHARRGSACLVAEPYEMVMYDFIRYKTKVTKYTVENAPEIARKHDDYVKKIAETGNVIAEGLFGEDGGLLIMKGTVQTEMIEADPSVTDGLYQIEFKKLYVAKGAFCEQ